MLKSLIKFSNHLHSPFRLFGYTHFRTNTPIMTQFTVLQLLDDTLTKYEQINESSSGINISTDSCAES